MFESWNILKIEYLSPGSPDVRTRVVAFMDLGAAEHLFSQLQLSYQFNAPVRVRGDEMITVKGLWLYQVSKFRRDDAIAALKSGEGTLLAEARGIDVELGP
ncbi:MAG: hypothetical protein ACREEB_08760 [Caulobacteraceae bacterium]